MNLLILQKIFRGNSSLLENSPESPFGHVSWVVGDGGVQVSCWIVPKFVATGGMPVEEKTMDFKPFDDFTVTKTGQTAHGYTPTTN